MTDFNRVMTAQEVGDYLRLPLSTVYSLTKRGILKGAKFGKHWRYLESEIHAYLFGVSPASNGHSQSNGSGGSSHAA